MFANATFKGDISQRVVATLVASAVVLMSIGFYTTAQAASLVAVSDTLSDSHTGVTSGHTIAFTIPAGSSLSAAQEVTITFPGGFTGASSVVGGDLTVTVNGGADTATNVAPAGNGFSFDGIDATAGQEVVVAIADGVITNPGFGSYEIEIATPTDIGKTQVAIISNVLVEAIVDTQFVFTISGVTTGTSINGETTSSSTSATSIDFDTLTAGVPEVLGQRLNVTTNANNGFVVTVETDGDLESANGAVIDNFTNGTDVAIPGTAWTGPANTLLDEKTWGHWGVTTDDSDLGSLGGYYSNANFDPGEFIAASTTPREVFHHNGPSDGVANDVGSTTVAYKIQITALQEAADDYNTTLTYIATPTF